MVGFTSGLAKNSDEVAAGLFRSAAMGTAKSLDTSMIRNLDISDFVKNTTNSNKIRSLTQQGLKNPELAAKLKTMNQADKLKLYDDLADTASDLALRANRARLLSTNAKRALAGGVVAGGLVYIDRKYKQASEDIKDCMKVCLPTNWDDFEYGTLDKSELQYKTLDDNEGQPVCSESMQDCGKFCGDKCEEIHEYDAPGVNLVKGSANTAGDVAGSVFKSLFGGLFKGLGLDGSTGMIVSGICLCLLFSFFVFMFLK
jgi:hypothetical protein